MFYVVLIVNLVIRCCRYRLVDNTSGKEDSEDEDKTVKSSQDLHKTDLQRKESKSDPDLVPPKRGRTNH